ncbi:response regulator [Sorangium sp. So ce131]|uniref:hybrid sensor histidine kinase/response regulator n=1 Tax=Sorangium sp. So ce131 TaxID=3133282 RepID=UPI003F5F229C
MSESRPIRVLIVEDCEDDARLVCATLQRGGYTLSRLRAVQTAGGLAEALEEDWDVILSDYRLPSFTARDALAIVQQSGKDIPFIVVSGSIGEDIAVEMMKAGAHDYFRKENMVRLVPAIEREIAERRQRDARRALERERDALLENERKARADAEAANRLKDDFLATLSHELRTPLNAILGWAQLLRSESVAPSLQRLALEVIERNAKAQAQLIEDLLDVSRLSSGQLALAVRDVDLGRAVQAAVDAIRPAAAARQVELRVVLDPQAVPVAGDPERLQQVAWNLLSNAVRFTPAGGRVEVAVTREGNTARLEVRDTGEGISPGFLPHIFDRFRQEDSSMTRAHGGLGLGLSIVRQLVELHGGAVRAESDGKGRGATFTVTLPVRQPSSRAAAPGRPREAVQLDGVRVLVVDDDDDARELVSYVLEDRGAEVVTASSAEEALRLIRAQPPHLLLSDIGMPGMDGFELIRRVRALPPEEGGVVPAIALTAYAGVEDSRKAMREGYQMHLPKPVSASRLLRIIADLASWREEAAGDEGAAPGLRRPGSAVEIDPE